MIIPEGQLITFQEEEYIDDYGNEHCQLLMPDQTYRFFQIQKQYNQIEADYNFNYQGSAPKLGGGGDYVLGSVPNGSWLVSIKRMCFTASNKPTFINLKIGIDTVYDILNDEVLIYNYGFGGSPMDITIAHDATDLDLDIEFDLFNRQYEPGTDKWIKVMFDSIDAATVITLLKLHETTTASIDTSFYISNNEIFGGQTMNQTVFGQARNFRFYEEEPVEARIYPCNGLPEYIEMFTPTEENGTHYLYSFGTSTPCYRWRIVIGDNTYWSNKFYVCEDSKYNYTKIEVDNQEMCLGNDSLYPWEYTNEIYLATSILNKYRKDQKIESLDTYKGFRLNYQSTTSRAVTMSIFKPLIINLEPYIIDFFYLLLGKRFLIDGIEYQANEQDFLDKEDEKFSKITLELDIYGRQSITK